MPLLLLHYNWKIFNSTTVNTVEADEKRFRTIEPIVIRELDTWAVFMIYYLQTLNKWINTV